ncbi:MAG: tripartite tricarboxylate transporter substrate-binding protein [Hyphomicrobiaceae bacterium]
MKSLLTAIALALTNAGGAFAQDYPSRPITMIVPFAAGGAADAIGRIMADGISRHIGQPVVVENIGGTGGATGSARVKNARPDGYTIGLGSMGTHAASVPINPKLPFDPRTDFDYLGLVSSTPNALFVRKDFPASTLKEYVAYAKAKGKDLKLGHSGIGSAPHITIVLLSQLIGVEPTMVAYRGFGQTINDILSGAIDGSCDLVAAVSGHVQGGSVKALVIAVDERSPAVPDVPTANEAGLPEFKVETWTGLYAPKGSPPAVLAKLSEAIAKTLADPASVKRLTDIGAGVPKPERQGGAHMQRLVVSEVDRWRKILVDVKVGE